MLNVAPLGSLASKWTKGTEHGFLVQHNTKNRLLVRFFVLPEEFRLLLFSNCN